MTTKVCTKCGVEKPLGEYNKKKRGKHGVESQCRDCRKQYGRQYRKDNKEYVNRAIREWQINNPVKVKEGERRWRANNPEKVKEYRVRNRNRLIPSYVKVLIRRKYNIATADITPETIEMKRRSIKYYRELNQLKKLTK